LLDLSFFFRGLSRLQIDDSPDAEISKLQINILSASWPSPTIEVSINLVKVSNVVIRYPRGVTVVREVV